MKYSLLYPDGAAESKQGIAAVTGSIGPRTLYHLSADRLAELFITDDAVRAYFLEILSKPLLSPRAVTYRQEILTDFLAEPEFFDLLSQRFDQFDGLRESHIRERQSMMRRVHNTSAGTSAIHLKALLQANALTLKRCLAFIRSISDTFSGIEIRSEGLKQLERAASDISASPAYETLSRLCSYFAELSETAPLDFRVTINEAGQISDCVLAEHRYLRISDPEAPQKRHWFWERSRQPEAEPGDCVRLHLTEDTVYDRLCAVPLLSLAEAIDEISDQLFERFCGEAPELAFYRAGTLYVNELKKRKIYAANPSVTEGDTLRAEDLSDLWLLLTEKDTATVVPCQLGRSEMEMRGMIVFGDNGTGKTVFLRTVGMAQLFAQAGLPVPARKAVFPVQTQIVTQFSEAEKEFEKGNNAGRFEQEVRELASVIDTLDDGALVLLNETFQTTAYEEGAEGLSHILSYFAARHIRFLLVSHLRQLETRIDRTEAGIFRTHPGYQVLPET